MLRISKLTSLHLNSRRLRDLLYIIIVIATSKLRMSTMPIRLYFNTAGNVH